jgi:hypothetical protein
MMAIGRPVSCSMRRMISWRSRCWSWPPWLKFSRKTSAPASNSARMVEASELDGPSVATILALRWRRIAVRVPSLRG